MKNFFSRLGFGTVVTLLGALILAMVGSVILCFGTMIGGCATHTFVRTEYENCLVTDKESITEGDDHRYLIYCKTESGETKVFENTDQLIYGKFDSSDKYADIEIGERYNFKVSGIRVPFLSWYENIVEFEEVESNVV